MGKAAEPPDPELVKKSKAPPIENRLFVGSDNALTLRLAKEELANEVKAWFLGKSEESSRALFC